MNNFKTQLSEALKKRCIENKKFDEAILPLLEKVWDKDENEDTRRSAANEVVLYYKVKVFAEKSPDVLPIQTYKSFGLIIRDLFDTGKLGDVLVDIDDIDDERSSLSEDDKSTILNKMIPQITIPLLRILSSPEYFEHKSAAVWGNLEEKWLAQEPATKENISRFLGSLDIRPCHRGEIPANGS